MTRAPDPPPHSPASAGAGPGASAEGPWTVARVLAWTAKFLAGGGSDSPRLDAEVLLGHVLGLPRIQLYVQHDRPLDRTERERYREVVRRRGRGEPVAYLTGWREFWSLPFRVTRDVLIPRPETEVLVEECLAPWRALPRTTPPAGPARVADVGTGSGVLAVVLAREWPTAEVYATDLSPAALAVAAENAALHGVAARVHFAEGELLEPCSTAAPFDLIVSNPPYVPSAAIAGLARDVAAYEPHGALDGGPDGLGVARRLVEAAPPLLAPGGYLALELGDAAQLETVARTLAPHFEDIRVRTDLAGLPRVLRARRRA